MTVRPSARPREAALHETALRLFRERGFHATSMQDLAQALGMNRGSLYHYIASKDDLLWAVMNTAMARLEGRVLPALDGSGTGSERLAAGIRAHLAVAAGHAAELVLLQMERRALTPARFTAIQDRRDAYEGRWRAAIATGVADGSLRATDPKLTGMAVLSLCNWFTQWYRADGPMSPDDVAHAFTALLLDGLSPTQGVG